MSIPIIPEMPSLTGVSIRSGAHAKDTPEKIHDAATQFESILIGQILKATQGENGEGWLGDNEDQSAGVTMDLATDFFARALASKGGLGLTRMISASLESASNSSNAIRNHLPAADTAPQD